jgi:DNA-binding LytR/AlgR family response regulator
MSHFQNLHLVAVARSYDEALDVVLEHRPALIFLEIDSHDKESKLSLHFVNELYRYLQVVPKIIVTTRNANYAFDALRLEVFDYLLKPLQINELRKTILKFEKLEPVPMTELNGPQVPAAAAELQNSDVPVPFEHDETKEVSIEVPANAFSEEVEEPKDQETIVSGPNKPLIICVKSYGDYRFIEAKDICYLQADNNSTDIHLSNGEMITAFKTLKHFEGVLSSPFVRIHNSYIVNIDYVSRIHTGNAVCYIKNTTTKLPFSKSYKDNVDSIISSITTGNYLEI